MPVAATEDIADKAVELLVDRSFTGHTSVEIISDRISFDEIARILGETLDIPSLRYMEFSDSDMIVAFTGMGFSRSVASSYVELMHGIAEGLVKAQDHDPDYLTGKVRFTDFAREVFKPAFTAAKHHTPA